MSAKRFKWGFEKAHGWKGTPVVWLDFPAFGPKQTVGSVHKQGSKWAGTTEQGEPVIGRTKREAGYAVVGEFLDKHSEREQAKCKPPMHHPYRPDRRLTETQANTVWDVLVEGWDANESDRSNFVYHMTSDSPPTEWRCGWGKFRNNAYDFGLSQYAEDVDPFSRWLMVTVGLKLEALYEEWFGADVEPEKPALPPEYGETPECMGEVPASSSWWSTTS